MIGIGYLVLGIFVLFFPGFLLSFLLYSDPKSLDAWQRIATSVGLSALADTIVIVILSQPTFSALRLVPFVASVILLCAVFGVILYIREESRQSFFNFFRRSNPADSSSS
jgi:uncharacterized membrane protein